MPAKRKMTIRDTGGNQIDGNILTIEIEIQNEASVYYTDNEVRFDLVIKNQTNLKVTGTLSRFLGRGNGTIDHTNNRDIPFQIEVPPKGEQRIEGLTTGPLTHQSNALIGVSQPGTVQVDRAAKEIHLSDPQTTAGDMYYQEGYSFTVWDREFYMLNYKRPRHAQYASAAFAVLIILVGVYQIISF